MRATMQSARIAGVLVGMAAVCGISIQAQAASVFSDNFDSGILSGWTKTTNYGGTSSINISAFTFVSSPNSLETHLIAPPGGSNLFVNANHQFDTTSGTYTFTLMDTTEACQGCNISATVAVDGTVYDSYVGPNIGAGPGGLQPWKPVSFDLLLTAGTHTLSLGMFTNVSFNGDFTTYFDDVSVDGPPTTTPIPAALPLFATGLGALGLLGWRRKRKASATA